ncbi:hypothetical protein BBK82_20330 [Lentzea guizhouensis]|uniref:Glycosyl transferase n=1 Tax=Lentzea guizhouensis TaxID=1586287 RepID=A0A1B2HK18_9PSEU|nr:glycosyltransferase [Lentzea guizhouensis]ANZ38057.1 hypothetical protein BBK82_20330 [Lentzea guizhouensis]
MRILFSSLGSHGHTYPLLPLAVAAREQGHDILYAVDSEFHAVVAKLGFTVIDAGLSIGEAFSQANSLHGTSAFTREMLRQTASDAFGSVLPRAYAADLAPVLERDKPDLVVFEIINPGAGIAAMRAGIPVVCHGFGKVDEMMVPATMIDPLMEYLTELGIALPNGQHFGLGAPYLDIFPPSLQDLDHLKGVERIPVRPVPFAEREPLPGWVLEHRRPLVYLTFGTAFAGLELIQRAVAGLSRLDAEVLVATGPQVEASLVADAPDNVHVMSWVPQADLLAHADLVVHHGGSGTTVSALTTGLPQLVLPQGADQFRNGELVATANLGAHLVGEQFTADAVHETAARLLNDAAVHDAVEGIRLEIAAMPAPAEVVPKLVELAG